ncbi:hypothetical protein EN850_20790 [Mesorhizobium sp. M8A.F.Ca.ET.207.01.1.1]|uniref:hypothetical protein n=1 Tax=Mesorhizobium sp. M8A.F.Ca.ET.207.01.1.1 TaxID=2563968 RepID=UPI00109C2197|nr:hypothetical protein [Mesorhizobium sp. M8A.F.Ca.ET.207.01.1.1]TGQ79328.1 hypothetical protein EN850_20790 [Mesorhizobium sp. M8A.F.Ca.ET.207.01.1.1]
MTTPGMSYAINEKVERAALWLAETPIQQHPPVEFFVEVIRSRFKLTNAELIAAVREADRLRGEAST